MHSSALGTIDRIVLRSLSRAVHWSPLTLARYTSISDTMRLRSIRDERRVPAAAPEVDGLRRFRHVIRLWSSYTNSLTGPAGPGPALIGAMTDLQWRDDGPSRRRSPPITRHINGRHASDHD